MSKATFLTELEKGITGISQLEKERIMNYYNETLEDAIEDGISEEEAIKSLGTMDEILKQIHLEHGTSPTKQYAYEHKSTTARHILMFVTSPFWLTGVALLATLYLLYLTVLLVVATAILADIVLLLAGCINIFRIMIANFASGVVLLGCMLLAIGILPWLYWLLMKGISNAKVIYEKAISKGMDCWRKAVA